MVYVEKFRVKGKTYFKIVHTIRLGNRIIHKRKYIGKTLPSKQRLKQLKSEFLRQLHSQRYKYLSSKDFEEIENKKSEYKKEIKILSALEKEKQLKEFIIRFTYDSSKLAGVAVTLRQTSLILKDGMRSSLTFPLQLRDKTFGVVFFSSSKLHIYTPEHM